MRPAGSSRDKVSVIVSPRSAAAGSMGNRPRNGSAALAGGAWSRAGEVRRGPAHRMAVGPARWPPAGFTGGPFRSRYRLQSRQYNRRLSASRLPGSCIARCNVRAGAVSVVQPAGQRTAVPPYRIAIRWAFAFGNARCTTSPPGLPIAELALRAALTDDEIERIEEGGTEPTILLRCPSPRQCRHLPHRRSAITSAPSGSNPRRLTHLSYWLGRLRRTGSTELARSAASPHKTWPTGRLPGCSAARIRPFCSAWTRSPRSGLWTGPSRCSRRRPHRRIRPLAARSRLPHRLCCGM